MTNNYPQDSSDPKPLTMADLNQMMVDQYQLGIIMKSLSAYMLANGIKEFNITPEQYAQAAIVKPCVITIDGTDNKGNEVHKILYFKNKEQADLYSNLLAGQYNQQT